MPSADELKLLKVPPTRLKSDTSKPATSSLNVRVTCAEPLAVMVDGRIDHVAVGPEVSVLSPVSGAEAPDSNSPDICLAERV